MAGSSTTTNANTDAAGARPRRTRVERRTADCESVSSDSCGVAAAVGEP
jgi:hypothetical protein